MTRTLRIAAAALVLLLALCLGSVRCMKTSAERLEQHLPQLRELLHREQWPEAERRLELLSDEFERVRPLWELNINHDEMVDIEVAITDLRTALELRDFGEAIFELEELAFFIRHVPETERVDWGNIM